MVFDAIFVFEIAAEKIVSRGHPPRAKAAYGNPEHMFVDYCCARTEPLARPVALQPRRALLRRPTVQTPDPRLDQTSSLVRILSTTAEVNSAVPAAPPRSGVLMPEATVSSAAS